MPTNTDKKNKISSEFLDSLIAQVEDPSNFKNFSGIFQDMKKALIERLLEGELTHHLGYEKHERVKETATNYRNGKSTKTVLVDDNKIEIESPRDRDSSFQPKILPKGLRRFEGFDDKVISLYTRGMSVREIQGHLAELYGTDVSPDLISEVTDEVLDHIKEWQSRPLDSIYPIMLLDALVVKIRNQGHVCNMAVYVAIGYKLEGTKEVLGLWIEETEGAKFWHKVMNDLKSRGVQDIYIVCTDGLKGFPEAINAVFPKTHIQTCIVHMVRNSLKFVPYKDRKEVASDLKLIYKASTAEEALENLLSFEEKWNKKYPMIAKSWHQNWDRIIHFMDYPEPVRKIIYTTNGVESLNMILRKSVKTRGHFPNQDSATKLLFLVLKKHQEKWKIPARDWSQVLASFHVLFEDRFPERI
jgi:putative transposase